MCCPDQRHFAFQWQPSFSVEECRKISMRMRTERWTDFRVHFCLACRRADRPSSIVCCRGGLHSCVWVGRCHLWDTFEENSQLKIAFFLLQVICSGYICFSNGLAPLIKILLENWKEFPHLTGHQFYVADLLTAQSVKC